MESLIFYFKSFQKIIALMNVCQSDVQFPVISMKNVIYFSLGKAETSRNIIFLTFYFFFGGVGWAFSFSRVFRVQMNVLINAGSKEFVWNYLGSNKTKENSRLLNKGCVFGIRNRQSRYGCRIPQEKSQQLTAALIKKSGLIF